MAGARISIEVEETGVISALDELMRRATDPEPALRSIGEEVMIQTKNRIEEGGPAPSGIPWEPLRPVTVARKTKNKDRVLVYLGHLLGDIHYQADAHSVQIGTGAKYGAAMQFGMVKGYAGTNKRGSPIPWGDIPPRPYLGLSDSDAEAVTAILRDHLFSAI
ncbi:MAG: phage virion morphogenesis protein [Gammaproteobacteria bacterium]